jgi:hypothetical protein
MLAATKLLFFAAVKLRDIAVIYSLLHFNSIVGTLPDVASDGNNIMSRFL